MFLQRTKGYGYFPIMVCRQGKYLLFLFSQILSDTARGIRIVHFYLFIFLYTYVAKASWNPNYIRLPIVFDVQCMYKS